MAQIKIGNVTAEVEERPSRSGNWTEASSKKTELAADFEDALKIIKEAARLTEEYLFDSQKEVTIRFKLGLTEGIKWGLNLEARQDLEVSLRLCPADEK